MKLTKKDELLIRSAFRHYQKYERMMGKVKAPVSEATLAWCGESDAATIGEGIDEDEFIQHIRDALADYEIPEGEEK